MPNRHHPTEFGDLILQFKVHFPTALDPSTFHLLRSVLPKSKQIEVGEADEIIECGMVDSEGYRGHAPAAQGATGAEPMDVEEGQGQETKGGVQCAQ